MEVQTADLLSHTLSPRSTLSLSGAHFLLAPTPWSFVQKLSHLRNAPANWPAIHRAHPNAPPLPGARAIKCFALTAPNPGPKPPSFSWNCKALHSCRPNFC
ncbi:UNVERIFIED_CONTAM: hypothetical protein K2H54_001081 [Gekko kuhli]